MSREFWLRLGKDSHIAGKSPTSPEVFRLTRKFSAAPGRLPPPTESFAEPRNISAAPGMFLRASPCLHRRRSVSAGVAGCPMGVICGIMRLTGIATEVTACAVRCPRKCPREVAQEVPPECRGCHSGVSRNPGERHCLHRADWMPACAGMTEGGLDACVRRHDENTSGSESRGTQPSGSESRGTQPSGSESRGTQPSGSESRGTQNKERLPCLSPPFPASAMATC